jgi:hypothetical protein
MHMSDPDRPLTATDGQFERSREEEGPYLSVESVLHNAMTGTLPYDDSRIGWWS